MDQGQKKNENFFFLTFKKQVSRATGKPFWKAKFSYAIDALMFEKKDGSGDFTVMLSPQDMELMKQRQANRGGQQQRPPQRQAPQQQPQKQYAPPSQDALPDDLWEQGDW